MFPAISLAQYLCKQGNSVTFITDPRGAPFLESQENLLKNPLFSLKVLKVKSFSGSFLQKVKAVLQFISAGFHAFTMVRNTACRKTIGFGAFCSFWPLAWSLFFKKKLFIYQLDSVMGRVNALFAIFAQKIWLGFPQSKGIAVKHKHKTRWVGLLSRATFKANAYPVRQKEDVFQLLIIGGSQGAKIFSDMLPEAIKMLPATLQSRLFIRQQCRSNLLESTQHAYASTHATVDLESFIQNMPKALAHAHFVIARAGAGTIAELICTRKPALLIPYPFGTNDHQTENAKAICQDSLLTWQAQKTLSAKSLANTLQDYLENPHLLEDKVNQGKQRKYPNTLSLIDQDLTA